jgi:hypothetical protein
LEPDGDTMACSASSSIEGLAWREERATAKASRMQL